MKKTLFLLSFLIIGITAIAEHISGGEMSYTYLGPGTQPGTLKYQVTLRMYRDCSSNGAALDPVITFTVFNTQNNIQVRNIQNIIGGAVTRIQKTPQDPCIADAIEQLVCFDTRTYTTIIDNLPVTAQGYTVTYQRCCRVNGMFNISSFEVGSTYFAIIPGNVIPGNETNSSPVFVTKDTVLICSGKPILFDFSANDPNAGDSLSYSFYTAFTGGGNNQAPAGCFTCIIPDPSAPPQYIPVTYINGFSSVSPLGGGVSINPLTGLISGVAPNLGVGANSIFAITVLVTEWRAGVRIGEHFKDLQIRVVDCHVPTAFLNPLPVTCDGFTVSFSNNAFNNPPPSFYWEFNDPISGVNNTSTLENPSHTFTDTGIYIIKLVLNQGLQCGDSTYTQLAVYPGFFPNFGSLAPHCIGIPVQFNDSTLTNYGIVDSWSWNFGDLTSQGDTSHQQFPQYTYNQSGTFNTTFIVSNSKGCKDTINRPVTILPNPVLSLAPGDTTYCGLDSLQLTATGIGTFTWTPSTNISAVNSATPLVYPITPTNYAVTLDFAGCKSRDTIRVTPLFDLTNAITANPVNICQEDTLILNGSSNHTNVSWQWTPTGSLSTPALQSTNAYPSVNTSYRLTTRWGTNCVAIADKAITVIPLANPFAGTDTSYCQGQQGITLSASGGSSYQWSPAVGLSNPNIPNPVATPDTTTTYIVSVGVNGCARRRSDTIVVTVRPRPELQMPRDTLICVIDTLQLNAGGTGNFVWSPNYNINNTGINNPLVSPDVPTLYKLRLTDVFGCFIDDSVLIDVKTDVSVNAGPDTAICRSDGYALNTVSDGVSFSWSPSLGLSDTTIKNPFANPDTTTTYILTANIGKCQRTSNITIKVVPYPVANAGADPTVCIGFNTQLTATGGSFYNWSPATFLSDPGIANPAVLQPTVTTRYIVTVTDTLGCPKPVKDSVYIIVIPHLHVDAGPQDTSIVKGEPLLLQASGALTYVWSPDVRLSNSQIFDPVATPENNIQYLVTGWDAAGCMGSDSINVTVYDLEADMYVPTAFTPNGDNNNDFARPVMIGMRSLTYFRIYNRFGQLVFSTTEIGKGWNGTFAGKAQDMATFVWYAEGITYKNQVKKKKGYLVLIR